MKSSMMVLAAGLAVGMFAQAKDFDPRAFGAKADGKTKDTAAIQQAIDACSKAGGGEVRLAGGTFLSGMIQLKDGVILDIAADATLLGSTNGEDFACAFELKHLENARVCRGRSTALIVADECRNVGVTGRGTIDCNGMAFVQLSNSLEYGYENEGNGKTGKPLGEDEWVNWRYRRIPGKMSPPRMILFAGCQDVKVTDVSLVRQAAGWGFWVNDCDRVVFDRVKIISNPELPNNDGIHVNCSRDVSIANCRIEAGDDALVFRANHRPFRSGGPRPCERITVVNCQLTSRANCIRIGWLNDGVVRNATFSNLTMTDSACGIGIDLPPFEKGMDDYGDEASLYENLVFDSIVMDRVYAAPIRIDITDKDFTRMEAIRNLTFSNIRARAYRWPSVKNLKKDRPLENVVFSNCSFTRCADGTFPNLWKQMGAAYWWYRDGESFCGVKGVRFDGCTFDESDEKVGR